MSLSRCQGIWGPQSRWGGELGFSLLSIQGFRHPFILWDKIRACIQATSGKSDLISSQGILVSTPFEAGDSVSLSHTYCWGKAPLDLLEKSWPNRSIESWKSVLFSRRYGVHGAFLEVLCWNWYSYRLETCVSGNLGSCLKEVKPLSVYDGEQWIALEPMQQNSDNLELIWATPSYVIFLRWHQCSSRLVRDFWGTLCTSVKQIKAPYLFDWEQGIALYAMQVNWESSLSEREISCFFQVAAGNWGVFSSYGGGSH